jgi:hypothetical protein
MVQVVLLLFTTFDHILHRLADYIEKPTIMKQEYSHARICYYKVMLRHAKQSTSEINWEKDVLASQQIITSKYCLVSEENRIDTCADRVISKTCPIKFLHLDDNKCTIQFDISQDMVPIPLLDKKPTGIEYFYSSHIQLYHVEYNMYFDFACFMLPPLWLENFIACHGGSCHCVCSPFGKYIVGCSLERHCKNDHNKILLLSRDESNNTILFHKYYNITVDAKMLRKASRYFCAMYVCLKKLQTRRCFTDTCVHAG